MKPVQIGTQLHERDETTAIYEKYPDYFEVYKEYGWLVRYVVSKEPSDELKTAIEGYYAKVKEENTKHDEFVDRVANDVLQKLDEKKKEYIFLHPDSTTHHFGLGLWIRNNYIHGKDLDFECWHPDNLSSKNVECIASLLIPNYDYENPFYHYLYDDMSFNHMRRQYFAVTGDYPDALMDQQAWRPDERRAAAEVRKAVKNTILDKRRFRRLCKEYGIHRALRQRIIDDISRLNRIGRIMVLTTVPYDIGLLTCKNLDPALREKLLFQLQVSLNQVSDVATQMPRYVFNQKDAVLLAVSADGKSLKRFPKFSSDDDVIRAALVEDGEAIEYVRKDLRDNPDYIRIALSNKYSVALKKSCMAKYRDDEEVVRIALEANGRNNEYASDRLKDDLETAKFAVTHQKNWYPDSTVCNLSSRLRDTLEIALLDIRQGHACVRSYSERLRDSEEVAETLIETGNKWRMYEMSERIQEKYKDVEQE